MLTFTIPTTDYFQRFLGTNPITCAAPSSDPEDPFVLDMATTAVAQGKVIIVVLAFAVVVVVVIV